MCEWRRWAGLLACMYAAAGAFCQQYENGEGVWLKGDFHVHSTNASNDTGGDSFVKAIKRKSQERGLYFVVLTDHSNSTGSDVTTTEEDPALYNQGNEFPRWDSARIVSEPGKFLMVCGNEISPIVDGEVPLSPTGHIGCIPRSLDVSEFDTTGAFTDRPRGSVNGANVLEQSNSRGAFSIINHPTSPTPWISYDWTNLQDYHGMEVWNGTGGWDPFDEIGYDLWRTDLLQGKNITPVGGSDNHRVNKEVALFPPDLLNPALGFPTTSVYAKDSTWQGIMEGLNRGWVCIHEGESFLQINALDAEGNYTDSSHFTAIRMVGKLDANAPIPFKLELRQALSAVDQRPYVGNSTVAEVIAYTAIAQPGDSFDVTVPVFNNTGLFTATLLPSAPLSAGNETHYVALSRAIRGTQIISSVTEEKPSTFFQLGRITEESITLKIRAAAGEAITVSLLAAGGQVLFKNQVAGEGTLQELRIPKPQNKGVYAIRVSFNRAKKSWVKRVLLR